MLALLLDVFAALGNLLGSATPRRSLSTHSCVRKESPVRPRPAVRSSGATADGGAAARSVTDTALPPRRRRAGRAPSPSPPTASSFPPRSQSSPRNRARARAAPCNNHSSRLADKLREFRVFLAPHVISGNIVVEGEVCSAEWFLFRAPLKDQRFAESEAYITSTKPRLVFTLVFVPSARRHRQPKATKAARPARRRCRGSSIVAFFPSSSMVVRRS